MASIVRGVFLCFCIAIAYGDVLKYGFPADDGGEHWAVLVAGSSMWWNYRHQVSYQQVKVQCLTFPR